MRRILQDKLIELVRGEEGVAFVVTLGVFFFMYLVIAGVYAVGTSVRERIHLQNACDAAAYSAAVVQADTLSRIATINRAMSWTYVQMVKRQQDYIVWKWLLESCWRYEHTVHTWIGCNQKRIDLYEGRILLNKNKDKIPFESHVKGAVDDFDKLKFNDASFYAVRGVGVKTLTGQINEDRKSISLMNTAIESLKDTYSGHVDLSAKAVFHANNIGSNPKIFKNDIGNYVEVMSATDEDRFVKFSRPDDWQSYAWFELGSEGIERHYSQKGSSLIAEWWYYVDNPIMPGPFYGCCKGADVKKSDTYFNGHVAKPQKMLKNYFGSDGTITVGIASQNENPWLSVIKTISGGLYTAFDPYCAKTIVFASAKAGYRTYDEGMPRGRNYRIDWNGDDEEKWNLYTSDWDAVLIPVRMAKSSAMDGSWSAAKAFLGDLVGALGVNDKRDNMLAGGTHEPSRAFIDELDNDRTASQTAKKWRWYNSDRRYDYAGKRIEAKWQVGNPGGKLKWDKLTDRMFH